MNDVDIWMNENYIKLMWGEFSSIAQNYRMAPLILSFSVIEASAKLSAPDNLLKSWERFIWWVNEFLRNVDGTPYPALDLYGARCGLFHEYGAESDLSRRGESRVIAWTSGERSKHNLYQGRMLILSREQFFDDLKNAGLKQIQRLRTNVEMNRRFAKRLSGLFGVYPR